jgi:hypothetical protein
MRPLGIEKKELDWDMVEKALKEELKEREG